MRLDRFDQLTRYIELLLRATDLGFKLNHEINTAFKQLEFEMQLDGRPFDKNKFIVNSNGSTTITGNVTTTNATFTNNTSKLKSGQYTDEYIEKLIEEGKLPNGNFKKDIISKLIDMGITLDFKKSGIRWLRTE